MPETNQEDLFRKVSVAQAMLDRVIHTTDNLDEKVGRIFSSMSFLTVGATILFTNFLSYRHLFFVGGVDLVSLLFVGFVLSVAVATAFMLQAMGPRVNLFPWGGGPRRSLASGPNPTGYADKIAKLQEEEWVHLFDQIPVGELYDKWYSETVREVYELSKKVERKVGEMKRAQRWFLLAIVFLILMITLGVSSFL